MSLTEQQLRDRSFAIGSFSKTKKMVTSALIDIKAHLTNLFNKTHQVKVTNPVESKDYTSNLNSLKSELGRIVSIANKIEAKEVDLSKLDELKLAIKDIKIPQPKDVDFSSLKEGLLRLEKAINSIKIPETKLDNTDVVTEIQYLSKAINGIKFPPVNIPPNDSTPILKELKALQSAVEGIKITTPKNTSVNLKPVIKALESLKKNFNTKPPKFEFPDSIAVNNWPPTKTPQPVTNININPLRGIVHTSSTSVTSTLTTLPGYGVLDGRRSIIFQNTSVTIDVYIGGSDVSTSNGYVLEASAVSPAFDSGPLQKWYAITSSGTADIRVVEIQNDSGA